MSSDWSATVLTLYPDMFPGPLGASLAGKALKDHRWRLEVRDIRDHGIGKHRSVDDTPSGGGPGMVMRADVAAAAIDAVERGNRPLIYLSPRGVPLTQTRVRALSDDHGLDARVGAGPDAAIAHYVNGQFMPIRHALHLRFHGAGIGIDKNLKQRAVFLLPGRTRSGPPPRRVVPRYGISGI